MLTLSTDFQGIQPDAKGFKRLLSSRVGMPARSIPIELGVPVNEKKWRLKKDIFRSRLNATVKTYQKLAEKAKVAPGTITNAQNDGCRLETIEAIARNGLGMGDEWPAILIDEDRNRLEATAPEGVYPVSWQQLVAGAEEIGRKVFVEERVNALITFPGPSLIFTGLMMAKALTREESVRMPVYVALLVDRDAPSTRFPQFDAIPMERFTILLPKAVTRQNHDCDRRIGVVDDAILTGKTMDALRAYFGALKQKTASVEFACYICHDGRTLLPETTPICKVIRTEKIFRMPWGDASAFEHCFESSPPSPGCTASRRSAIRK